jgi:hypothetical protein
MKTRWDISRYRPWLCENPARGSLCNIDSNLRRCLLDADRGKNENKRGERHQNRVLNLATYHLHVTTLWTCDEFLHCSHNSRAEGTLAILAAT